MASIQAPDSLPFPEFATILPPVDRRCLSGLVGSEIRSLTLARAEEYRKFALTLLAIHNLAAPIHCLPNELLSLIFAQAWHNWKSYTLAHVCGHWRRVLLATPRFWVDAIGGASFDAHGQPPRSPDYLAAVLERSRPLPIQPVLFHYTQALSVTLRSELWRITSLTVHAAVTAEVICLHRTLRKGMPVLTELIVEYKPYMCDCLCDCDECKGCDKVCMYNNIQLDMEPLPADVIPRLRHVHVPAFLFSKVAVPSLKSVELDRCEDGTGTDHENPQTDIEGLLYALAGCPELVRLELTGVLPASGELSTLSNAARKVSLPALEWFFIDDYSSEIAALMPYIHLAAPTACIHIRDRYSQSGDIEGFRECLQRRVLVDPLISDVDSVVLQMRRGSFKDTLECYECGEPRVRVESSWTLIDVDVLRDAFRSRHSLTSLTYMAKKTQSRQSNLLCLLLPVLPHLKTLTISAGDEGVDALDLLEPADNTTADEVICPRLERLSLDFCWSHLWSSSPVLSEGTVDTQREEAVSLFVARAERIAAALEARASRFGSRLTYLQYHECLNGPRDASRGASDIFTLDETSSYWGSVEPAFRKVRDLVDGPVVLAGCNFEQDDEEDAVLEWDTLH